MEITTRKEAKERGLMRYFTGKACKRGHVAERKVSSNNCCACVRIQQREEYRENIDRVRARHRDYARKNKEKRAAYLKKWRAENVELVRADALARRDANIEACRARDRAWAKANPHKNTAKAARRKARLIQATPTWLTPEHWREIESIYNQAAQLTKFTGVQYHVDHIVPLQGREVRGLHVPWNLQVLTAAENVRKHNRLEPAQCLYKS